MNALKIAAFLILLVGCGGDGSSGGGSSGTAAGSGTRQPAPSPSPIPSPVPPPPGNRWLAIPNFGNNQVAVRRVLASGDSAHVNNTATGTVNLKPIVVRRHPNLPVIYVSCATIGVEGTLDAFHFNSSNGTLTRLGGHPVASPATAFSLSIHPSGNFLYAAGADALRTYSIGNDGGLTALGTDLPLSQACERDGLFVGGGSHLHLPLEREIRTFAINGTDGTASDIGSTPVNASSKVLELHALANLVVGVCQVGGGGDYLAFQSNPVLGSLTPLHSAPLTVGLPSSSVLRQGRLYVSGSNFAMFSIDPTTGVPVPFSNEPFLPPTISGVLRMSPDSSMLFGGQVGGVQSAVFAAGGKLSATPNSPALDNINQPGFLEVLEF